MRRGSEVRRHRSIRLKGYDYSQAGAYFVTICVKNRKCLFGEIMDGEMMLNDAGRMIARWYRELTKKFHCIRCDAFVCMPNHIHFLIVNAGVGKGIRTGNIDEHLSGEHTGSSLPNVIQWYKTMTTNEYIRGVKQYNWLPFPGKLWQRNYWEHIVRNESELMRIQEYIIHNPAIWELDEYYSSSAAYGGDR